MKEPHSHRPANLPTNQHSVDIVSAYVVLPSAKGTCRLDVSQAHKQELQQSLSDANWRIHPRGLTASDGRQPAFTRV
jgi:hypothetical protein